MDRVQNDIAYLRRRLGEAELQAERAENAGARLAHTERARLYRARLAAIAAPAGDDPGLSPDTEGHAHDGHI